MVARRDVAVEKQAVQRRLASQLDPPLLDQLAAQRLDEAFADLDAAARQMPAGDIGVLGSGTRGRRRRAPRRARPASCRARTASTDETPGAAPAPAPAAAFDKSIAGDILLLRPSRHACAGARSLPKPAWFSQPSRLISSHARQARSAFAARTAMTAFTLAHLSDVHLPPLPAVRPHQLANKRVLGYLNWKKNRHTIHRREVLDTLVADMLAQAPDQIAVTGDLVNLALEQEFSPVAAMARQRRPARPGHRGARQSRRLCALNAASLRRNPASVSARRRGRRRRGAVSVPAPPRVAGADRAVERGADRAADGRPAGSAKLSSRRWSSCWRSSRAKTCFACC